MRSKCLPGTYSYRYSVTDADGNSTSIVRRVHIYYKTSSIATYPVLFGFANASAASTAAAALFNSTTQPYADAIAYTLTKLKSFGTVESDVKFLNVTTALTPPANTLYQVNVRAEVFSYTPSAVHHGGVTDFNAAAAAQLVTPLKISPAAAAAGIGGSAARRRMQLSTSASDRGGVGKGPAPAPLSAWSEAGARAWRVSSIGHRRHAAPHSHRPSPARGRSREG